MEDHDGRYSDRAECLDLGSENARAIRLSRACDLASSGLVSSAVGHGGEKATVGASIEGLRGGLQFTKYNLAWRLYGA